MNVFECDGTVTFTEIGRSASDGSIGHYACDSCTFETRDDARSLLDRVVRTIHHGPQSAD